MIKAITAEQVREGMRELEAEYVKRRRAFEVLLDTVAEKNGASPSPAKGNGSPRIPTIREVEKIVATDMEKVWTPREVITELERRGLTSNLKTVGNSLAKLAKQFKKLDIAQPGYGSNPATYKWKRGATVTEIK